MVNSEKKVDRRVIKTKKAIRNAVAKLLSEKSIDEITITDIAKKADLNRKTIYNYYSGIYQIIDEIENEIVTTFEGTIKSIDLEKDMQNPYVIFERLTNIINSDLDFYSHMLKMDTDSHLLSKITELLKDKLKSTLLAQLDVDEFTVDIMVDYAISGMISVYQRWFNSDRQQSAKKISETVSTICFKGFYGIMETTK